MWWLSTARNGMPGTATTTGPCSMGCAHQSRHLQARAALPSERSLSIEDELSLGAGKAELQSRLNAPEMPEFLPRHAC